MHPDLWKVRDAIRAELDRRGMTQRDLSRLTGIDDGALSRLLTGKRDRRNRPSPLSRVLDALDLEIVARKKG